MYVCEEILCFFLGSVPFLFLSLCSVVHYACDCSSDVHCTYMYLQVLCARVHMIVGGGCLVWQTIHRTGRSASGPKRRGHAHYLAQCIMNAIPILLYNPLVILLNLLLYTHVYTPYCVILDKVIKKEVNRT